MSQQTDLSKSQYLLVFVITIIIIVGGVLIDRYLKDNDLRDTYGDFIDKLHKKMDTWSCDKLLDWAYEDGGIYTPPPPERTYAKNIAREKCPLDESWKNPPIKIKEPVPTMDQLYDKWSKKK